MTKRWLVALLMVCLSGSSLFAFANGVNGVSARSPLRAELNVGVPSSPLPEAPDFATVSFGDAWDMAQFGDVSQYLNGAGRYPYLGNIQVKDGVFSAVSLGDRNANLAFFFPLYPGYANFMQIGGNLGSLRPIDPNAYRCVYIAMKADSQYNAGKELADGLRVLWNTDSKSGGTNQFYFYPETITGQTPIVHNWRLYKIDLMNPAKPNGNSTFGDAWNTTSWKGLQVNPTIYKNIPFAIDWIRLTSCDNDARYQAPVTWNGSSSVNAIWANPAGSNRNIMLVSDIDGSKGSYNLDTKGLAPGSYRIGLGTRDNCCSQWSTTELKINAAPLIEFVRPSPYSGEDYATSAGNPWDMDSSDVTRIDCSQWSFSDGILALDTMYPRGLPGNCQGSIGEADSQVFLNMPAPLIVGSQYRYLSFRLYQNGDVQEPADGMMGRWIWTATNDCTRVSADIPYDVGWHTYSIDLHDSYNGTPVVASPPGCGLKHWKEAGQLSRLRFDPNENWTGNLVPELVFHQQIDWIRLTKVDGVARGGAFPIQIHLSKPVDQLRSLDYFYTTNPNDPTQHPIAPAQAALPEQEAPALNPFSLDAKAPKFTLFLPVGSKEFITSMPGSTLLYWNTANVSPGEYYICARADDGYNQSTYCSSAPLQVY